MKTGLIDGKRIAKFDKNIIGNLLLNHVALDVVMEEKMIIGIRNEAGEIYRIIGATKLNSYMNAVEELFDLGLIDELQDVDGTRFGCDSIFSAVDYSSRPTS